MANQAAPWVKRLPDSLMADFPITRPDDRNFARNPQCLDFRRDGMTVRRALVDDRSLRRVLVLAEADG